MVNDQLEAIIREEFRNGKRRDEIRSELMEQGWELGEVDETISHIQRDALKQMPGVSVVVKKMEELEKKTANASPRMVGLVLILCVVAVSIISVILYVSLDPLGSKSAARDQERETDFIKLHNSISSYHAETGRYPSRLNDLMPKYLQALPLDPKTGAAYTYTPLENGYNYKLCVSFETKTGQCISAVTPNENTIPEVMDSASQENSTQEESTASSVPASPAAQQGKKAL